MSTKAALRQSVDSSRRGSEAVSLEDALRLTVDSSARIASYLAFGSEPYVRPRPGWLLPVLLPDGDLDWAVYDGTVATGLRGLQEPAGPRVGVSAIATCDLVLVPALLVDRTGVRLGKGGGSYDRALLRATGLTVALVGDHELVDVLPAEPHDVRVAAVATPSRGLIRLAETLSP